MTLAQFKYLHHDTSTPRHVAQLVILQLKVPSCTLCIDVSEVERRGVGTET